MWKIRIKTIKNMDVSFSLVSLFRMLNLNWLSTKFVWLRNAYLHKTQRIVLYGASGVGKTEFLHTILGKEYANGQRTQDIIEYRFQLPDGHKVIFIDTPGHPSLIDLRKRLQNHYSQQKIQGVINIVCYGYHSTPDMLPDKVFKAGTNDVKDEYLRNNRMYELTQVSEWQSFINARNQVKWFVTLVNKADVWYDNYEAVDNYYRDILSDYYDAISGIKHCCDIHTYLFCSVMKPFMGRFRSTRFSEEDKKNMLTELIGQLQRFANQ